MDQWVHCCFCRTLPPLPIYSLRAISPPTSQPPSGTPLRGCSHESRFSSIPGAPPPPHSPRYPLTSAFGEPRAPAYRRFGRPALSFMVGSGAVSSLLGCEGERIASGHKHVQLRVRAALCILDVRQGLQSGPRLIDF